MGLTAVTLLGENTISILDGLCAHLTTAGGIGVGRIDGAADADLVWGCGYLLCGLIDGGRLDAEIAAAPVFAGQRAPVYHSVVVVADPAIGSIADARGRVLAINEAVSWSGHHALVAHLATRGADLSMFAGVVETGSHRASVEAVATGRADLASIDHTIWEHLTRRSPAAAGVRVIERTGDWPAPPFAVHRRVEKSARDALVAVLVGLAPDVVAGLTAVAPATRSDYAPLLPEPRPPPSG